LAISAGATRKVEDFREGFRGHRRAIITIEWKTERKFAQYCIFIQNY